MQYIKDLPKIKRKDQFFYFYPDSTVSEIADMMDLKDIGAVPILDKENKLIGILSERDIVRKLVKNGRDSDLVTAEDIMTKEVKSATFQTKIIDAQLLMKKNNIRHLPIIDSKNLLLNFVSQRDLIIRDVNNKKLILIFITLILLFILITLIIKT